MDGGNNQKQNSQSLREEIANILPQQKSSVSSTPPSTPKSVPVFKPTPAPAQKAPIMPPKMEGTAADQKFVLRTMPSDLESLKKGENPRGFNVEKSGETQPRPTSPLAPPPKLELGKMKKAPAMAPPSSPTPKPSTPSPIPNIPDMGVLPPKTGGVPPSSPPSKPITPPPSATSPKKKSNLLGVIIVVLGLGILTYSGVWYFVLREEVSPTPTPTPTPSPTPVVKELEGIFGFADPITLVSTSVDPRVDLVQAIDSKLVNLNEIRPFTIVNENGTPYDFSSLMSLLGVVIPTDLANTLDINEYIFIIYGQTEEFDSAGNLVLTTGSSTKFKRIGFVVKSDSSSGTEIAMKNWETTLMSDVAELLQVAGKNPESSTFGNNVYNGVNVRYVNYPSPDLSIDYTISSGLSGKNYLIMTNSREAIYGTVDKLLGFLAE